MREFHSKSLVRAFTAFVMLSVLLVALCSCTFYQNEGYADDLLIYFSKVKHDAFAASFDWDCDYDNMTINVPETFKGYKITSLGGYFGRGVPSPFAVRFDIGEIAPNFRVSSASNEEIEEKLPNAEIVYLDFKLFISRNVTEELYLDMDSYFVCLNDNDGSMKIFVPRYNIQVDENNKAYSSEDGKLYQIIGNQKQLVDEIFYFDYQFIFN